MNKQQKQIVKQLNGFTYTVTKYGVLVTLDNRTLVITADDNKSCSVGCWKGVPVEQVRRAVIGYL
jgi:hypothetical protein